MIELLYVLSVILSVNCDEDWTYDDQSKWNMFKACNGDHESPINIESKHVKVDRSLKFELYNYDKTFLNSTAQNNGHTVRVFLTPPNLNETPFISGEALLKEKFILDSLHFHWGESDINGSEHSIDKIKRSGEIHLVHWNEVYGNMSNARDQTSGLAVIAVFMELRNKMNENYENKALNPIISALPLIANFSTNTRIDAHLNLKEFLPLNRSLLYKYEGSLTTPPCSQTATFLIFANPITISSKQLSQFRQLNGESIHGVSKPLTHNYRQQQPLNDRIVKVSHPVLKSIFG